jgi:hypothetical protein
VTRIWKKGFSEVNKFYVFVFAGIELIPSIYLLSEGNKQYGLSRKSSNFKSKSVQHSGNAGSGNRLT